MVDAAGNPAQTGSVSQAVVIDTNGPTDEGDANRGLKTTTIGMSTDTTANGSTHADFVTSDGGNKDGIANTDDDKLTFTGKLNNSFSQNGGKVLVKISDVAGHLISSAYVEPQKGSANTWTYEHLGSLSQGQYVVKSIVVDHVGNMISATDQSFIIDSKKADYKNIGNFTENSGVIDKMEFGEYVGGNFIYQYGTYKYGNVIGEYFGGNLNLGIQNGTSFAKGTFKMTFWDQAGNQTDVVNDKDWTFNNANVGSLTGTSANAALPEDFKGGQIIGSVGKLDILSNFDMATLYDGIDNVADQAAANHIVLSNTTNVSLTLSMGDVLALGVTNSFSVADADHARHKGQIQMLIDGQAGDTLNLDGWVNGLSLAWSGGQTSSNVPLTVGTEQYNVYTNAALSLALFVDKDIKVNVL